MVCMNKKGIAKALTLLLSIALIAVELTLFYGVYDKSLDPVTFTIKEVSNEMDNNMFLINLMKTETDIGLTYDLVVKYYLKDEYSLLSKQITSIVNDYYGSNYFWYISVGDKELDNYSLLESFRKKLIGESSITLPLYNKEVVEVEFKIFTK